MLEPFQECLVTSTLKGPYYKAVLALRRARLQEGAKAFMCVPLLYPYQRFHNTLCLVTYVPM